MSINAGCCELFKRCDFLLGDGHSIIIVIPGDLPDAETYTVSVSHHDIKFMAGYEKIAELPYQGGEIFERIAHNTQVGLLTKEDGKFPSHITHVAYVEVRREFS